MTHRRLAIMRHAKSSWDAPDLSDHARPLNDRGRRTAPAVGQKLAQLGWTPQVVLCSTAQRTRETWQALASHFVPEPEVEYLAELYLPSVEAMQAELRRLDPEVTAVLLISHNPGCEQLTRKLIKQSVGFKTADVALLEIVAPTWLSAVGSNGQWQLVRHLSAREVDPQADD